MTSTQAWRRGFGALTVGLLSLALVLPAASEAARPNPGKWDSADWTNPLSFSVRGKKAKRQLIDFTPHGSVSYTCADTGEEVSTWVSNIDARISRSGAFSTTLTMNVVELNRLLTVTLSGRFTSPTNASGTLFWDLAGCGTFLSEWSAYGPERKKKGPKKGGGHGKGNGDETCQWMPYPDGSFVWVCLPN